jgi:hypothetical protein
LVSNSREIIYLVLNFIIKCCPWFIKRLIYLWWWRYFYWQEDKSFNRLYNTKIFSFIKRCIFKGKNHYVFELILVETIYFRGLLYADLNIYHHRRCLWGCQPWCTAQALLRERLWWCHYFSLFRRQWPSSFFKR